jgi:putative ABC transport system permease protein
MLSGALGAAGASLTGQLVARRLLGLEYGFDPWLWLAGMAGAALAVGLAGLLATWPLLLRSPLEGLRRE